MHQNIFYLFWLHGLSVEKQKYVQVSLNYLKLCSKDE